MGAVGGVAILGGNFEASTFPEDKVVQRSLTAGSLETTPIEAIILDSPDIGAPGQRDSHATVWKGHSNDGSPHSIDWKVFVDVTADDGTGSIWTLQTRIDGAPYTDIMTVDDNGLLTVSGATFTMDQLIVDTDNTEAVIVRKDGDAGDVFIIDTINDVVRLGSNATTFTFGASSDVILERVSARVLQMNSDPGADSDNELRIVANDDPGVERYIQLLANGLNQARVAALRADGGARFDLELFTTSGSVEIWTDGVQRWTFGATSGGFDAEILPFITNRYDIGNTVLAVRDVFTNRVFLGQDQVAAYDAITIGATDLVGDGQQDSGAVIWTGKGFETATPHDIDWKAFVDVTANDGTGSIWTLQARIDGASFVDEFTILATTSPTLVSIGPGSTGGALAFGPPASAAQAGTVRFQNTDDIRFRNEGDDGDLIALAVGESNKMILGEAGILFIEIPTQVIITGGELTVDVDDAGAFRVLAPTTVVFRVDTSNEDIEIVPTVDRSAAVVDRLRLEGSNLSVNSTVGFSGAVLLQGQAREAGGPLHDANWRMYVEPLTGTGFDGQSVFKITAEIDTGGPTTVFTLSDTGDLIVPGSFTIDGLIIDVTSTEAFLVRKNADGGDVFNVDTSNDLIQVIGSAALEIGTTPATTGSIRLPNSGSVFFRNAADDGDLAVLAFDDSDTLDIGPQAGGIPLLRIWAADIILQGPTTVRVTSDTAFRVRDGSGGTILTVDTTNLNIEIGNTIPLQVATSVDRFIITGPTLTVNSTAAESHTFLIQGRTRTSGAVQHTSDWRMTVQPFSTTAFDGQSQLSITGGIDGGGLTTVVTMSDEGRFAITQPEQVSIGSPTFIDNVQLHLTGAFVDDYGGGPTSTHKFLITGSQKADPGRTSRQSIFQIESPNIITQGASEIIALVSNMTLLPPIITIGTGDTISTATNMTIFGAPGAVAGEKYALQVRSGNEGASGATVRIGTSSSRTALLVGSTNASTTLEDSAQVRFTGDYGSASSSLQSQLLHMDGRLLGDGSNTNYLNAVTFGANIRTTGLSISILNISQVQIDEPDIDDILGGGGLITNAQSLLITGAPTEGVDNYALRILGGDVQVANSAAILFRNANNNGDLTILSIGGTDFLEIGGPGSADVDRINLYANDFVRVNSDALVLRATAADHGAETQMKTTFADVATSAGSSVTAASLIPAGSFVIGITVRVLTTVGGPASFDVGDGIDVDRWGSSIGSGSGTVTDITDFTSGAVTTFPAANDVVITSTGVDFTSGSIRITVHYTQLLTSIAA